MPPFTWQQIRNCRRFYKRYYTTSHQVDADLLARLEVLGMLEIQAFSKYSSQALDAFKIRFDEQVDIAGTIGDTQIQVTIIKAFPEMLQQFEGILTEWVASKTDKKMKL